MLTVIPDCRFEITLSPQFCIEISSQYFHSVHRKMFENLL